MQFSSFFKYVTVFFLVLVLSACASHRGSIGDEDLDGEDDGAYSTGLGDSATYPGHGKNSLHAPENQTYYFDYDSSNVHPDDRPAVEAQAKYLASHPSARVVLEGNTDERGSREYNVALGERRAMAVADVLKLSGVSENQIRVVSYGEEKPAALGHDEEAYKANRRVHLSYERK